MAVKVYVLCPSCYTTGGIELLHQFTAALTDARINAKILYWNHNPKKGNPHPEIYNEYHTEYIVNKIPDRSAHPFVVFPEIWANTTWDPYFTDCRKIIYWESIDNYLNRTFDFPDETIHIAQSAYAFDYLTNIMGFKNIYLVTDYLNNGFLTLDEQKQTEKTPNMVIYNPAKGLSFTKQIIEATPGIYFHPLQNYNRKEMIEVMRRAPLYIDFGPHPGKDRLPREAAMCNCCILVGKVGSAAYDADMPIPRSYKLDFNPHRAAAAIRRILDNYDACIRDFEGYRQIIKREKEKFLEEVKIFKEEVILNG